MLYFYEVISIARGPRDPRPTAENDFKAIRSTPKKLISTRTFTFFEPYSNYDSN